MKHFLTLLLLLPISLWAEVRVAATLDSLRMVVGEQATLTLTAYSAKGKKVRFPIYNVGDKVVNTLEVVKALPIDTTDETMRAAYLVTSFDTATLRLPAFPIVVDGKTYETARLNLQVYGLEVDTAHVKKYYPIKDIDTPPLSWQDWKWIVLTSSLAVLLIVLAAVFYTWLRTGVPVIHLLRRKPKRPPHEVAMEGIDELKENKALAQEDSKAYYTILTDILRTYIRDRYAFNAMEMTSTEIIARLEEENEADALAELRDLFATADLAKFAKYSAMLGEDDAHLLTAIDYVARTKQEVDPNAKEEEPQLSPDDKRHLYERWTLRLLITLSLIAAVGLIAYDIYAVMHLL